MTRSLPALDRTAGRGRHRLPHPAGLVPAGARPSSVRRRPVGARPAHQGQRWPRPDDHRQRTGPEPPRRLRRRPQPGVDGRLPRTLTATGPALEETDPTGHMVGIARPTAYRSVTLGTMRVVTQSRKLRSVCYEIRGPVLAEAKRLEDEGHRILKLNIGNPAPFGFEAPEDILVDVIQELPTAQGYSDSKGILSARRAVKQHYELRDFPPVGVEDIYLGNGVSELIVMAMQGLLDNGDEVLIPAPDYPLWTAAASLAGGTRRALRLRRAVGLGARPRRHPQQGHRPHPRDRRHQPQQPDRRGLSAGGARGDRRRSPASTSSSSWPTRSTTRSSTTTPSTPPSRPSLPTCCA